MEGTSNIRLGSEIVLTMHQSWALFYAARDVSSGSPHNRKHRQSVCRATCRAARCC